jgi:glycosyltransferase involved in cell wall biosynthesis
MARILVRHLRELGYRVTVAHYATYRDYPELVVTSWQIFSAKQPGVRRGKCFDDFPCVSIGCKLPELEFTYYLTSAAWRKLIDSHDRHIAVGGTVLASYPLASSGIPHLVLCASAMTDDRIERRRSMPFPRRMLDLIVISPIQRIMERKILRGAGRFMAISSYTLKSLIAGGGNLDRFSRVPLPVDMSVFKPPSVPPRPGIIGFAGRPNDPRKNLVLLFQALKRLLDQGQNIELRLTGNAPEPLARLAEGLGISGRISWTGWLKDDDLPEFFSRLDVFVIPSFQEGLNIAGLQAMASAVPIVSTRCGGPEDYVIDGKTGTLVSFDARDMASAIAEITGDRNKRELLGGNARRFVEEYYSHGRFEASFAEAWQQTWGDRP